MIGFFFSFFLPLELVVAKGCAGQAGVDTGRLSKTNSRKPTVKLLSCRRQASLSRPATVGWVREPNPRSLRSGLTKSLPFSVFADLSVLGTVKPLLT